MNDFTLNVDTAEVIFDKNDEENGFVLITTNVPGNRLFRISREITTSETKIDYFDFYLSPSDFSEPPIGTLVTKSIPYQKSLFSASPTPLTISQIPSTTSDQFTGEIFKLLFITPTVIGDPNRETPSYVALDSDYTISGNSNTIRFIYWIMQDGVPVLSSYLGNPAFPDQYSESITIDPTKRVEVVIDTNTNVEYHIIRVPTTPGVIFSKGNPTSSIPILTDSYSDNHFSYTLRASSGGVQSWTSTTGLQSNGATIILTIVALHPSVIPIPNAPGFVIEPRDKIEATQITKLSSSEYQILVVPKVGVESMDLKVYINPGN